VTSSSPCALVTGAGGAIGTAIALRLAADGFDVVVNDVDPAAATATEAVVVERTRRRAQPIVADVSDAEAVDGMFSEIDRDFGRLDVLVNNAGVLRNAPVSEMSEAQWDTVIDVHLKGAFLCCRAAARRMRERGEGRIVNISSGAVRGSDRGHANYASAKAGLLGLTTALAVELGPSGVAVNAVAPGAVVSEMTRQTAAQLNLPFDDYVAQATSGIPLRRLGQPDDIAGVVAFFASADAAYVTGQVVFVSGGP
jgi:3-oxoacyl-[acyl-carrier protein] reductase